MLYDTHFTRLAPGMEIGKLKLGYLSIEGHRAEGDLTPGMLRREAT